MNEVTRHPIDYDAMHKGDSIPPSRIEEITGTKQGTTAYALKLLALRDRVEKELSDRGKRWTVKTEKEGLKILTDAEASIYNHALQEQYRRGQMRRFDLAAAVDVTKLDEEQRKDHERSMEIDGRYIQSMLLTKRQLQVEAHTRKTPKQIGEERAA